MSLRRNLGWMGLAQACFVITQFAGSVVLARLLSPHEMGVYALAGSVVALLSLIQSLGLSEFVVSEPNLSSRGVAAAFTVNGALAILVAILVYVLALFGGQLFNDDGVRQVLLVIALLPLIGIFEFRPGTMMKREARFKALAVVNICRHLTAVILTVILALSGHSYMSLAYGQVAGSLAAVALVNTIGFRHASFMLSTAEWRRLSTFGFQMFAISGVNSLCGRAADFALGRILGLAELGLFSRAQSMFLLVWNNVHGAIGSVLLTDFSAQRRSGRSLRESYLLAVSMLTGLLWPAFLGLAVLSGPLITFVYGDKWGEAALPLAFMCVSAVPLVAITMTWEVFIASGETARQARIETGRSVIGLILFIGGCLVSLNAAALSKIGDAIVTYIMYRRPLERMTDTHLTDFLGIYGRSALLSVAATLPAMALMVHEGWAYKIPPPLLFGSILAGGLLWLATLKLLNHPLLSEAMRMVRRTFATA